jgi:ABC-type multidrug transport system ATPase subunit
LAILSDTPFLLLDEPTTNLDTEGVQWYRQLIEQHTAGRTLVIASNVEVDFDFCEERINILNYKL